MSVNGTRNVVGSVSPASWVANVSALHSHSTGSTTMSGLLLHEGLGLRLDRVDGALLVAGPPALDGDGHLAAALAVVVVTAARRDEQEAREAMVASAVRPRRRWILMVTPCGTFCSGRSSWTEHRAQVGGARRWHRRAGGLLPAGAGEPDPADAGRSIGPPERLVTETKPSPRRNAMTSGAEVEPRERPRPELGAFAAQRAGRRGRGQHRVGVAASAAAVSPAQSAGWGSQGSTGTSLKPYGGASPDHGNGTRQPSRPGSTPPDRACIGS